MKGPKPKVCQQCQSSFDCFTTGCWCNDLPPLFQIDPNKDCYCPDCLKKEVQQKIKEELEDLSPAKIKKIKALGPPAKLVEGVDYYHNEEGYFVFTDWYHLRRGTCCNNACKHCPYGYKKQPVKRIYYITGGERSGKSGYAQNLALELSDNPIYVATSRVWDADFEKRVERHVSDRDERWTTLEEEKHLGKLDIKGKTVVIDCVTLWLTNWYVDTQNNVEESLQNCKNELTELFKKEANIIIISNEIGMGVHAQTHIGRKFTELQGWVNQFIAEKADEAIFMVSGLPMKLKE